MPDMVERRLNGSHSRIGAPSELSTCVASGTPPRESQPQHVEPHDQSMVDFVILATLVT